VTVELAAWVEMAALAVLVGGVEMAALAVLVAKFRYLHINCRDSQVTSTLVAAAAEAAEQAEHAALAGMVALVAMVALAVKGFTWSNLLFHPPMVALVAKLAVVAMALQMVPVEMAARVETQVRFV
jgi:hypothetical protein